MPVGRLLQSIAWGFAVAAGLAHVFAADEVFVSNYYGGSIHVYPRATNGDVPPTRSIRTGLSLPHDVAVDLLHRELFVPNNLPTEQIPAVNAYDLDAGLPGVGDAPKRTIIGPLTLKQFLYLAFAGALIFVFWFLFNFYFWLIVSIPVAALASAFAFLKINDRPFVYFFLSFIRYFSKPKLYIFSLTPPVPPKEPARKEKIKVPQIQEKRLTASKLKELALNLDIGADRINNEIQ